MNESNFQNFFKGILVFSGVHFPNIKGIVIIGGWGTQAKHHKNVMSQFFKLLPSAYFRYIRRNGKEVANFVGINKTLTFSAS